MASSSIKELINIICEATIEDFTDIQCAPGSTHIMSTCKLGDDLFYLKFSDDYNFYNTDPSLQVLIEYLAYGIYSLYPGIHIPPQIHLVYDKENNRVGIATSKIKGSMALPITSKDKLGNGLSAGVFVDIFLANWDVVGMDDGNIIVTDDDDGKFIRIDPGGSLTFRAQGGRKNRSFTGDANELKTMLSRDFGGSGGIFQYSDLSVAAKTFKSVSWESIKNKIKSIDFEIKEEIYKLQKQNNNNNLFSNLLNQWNDDINTIIPILFDRYKKIEQQVNFII